MINKIGSGPSSLSVQHSSRSEAGAAVKGAASSTDSSDASTSSVASSKVSSSGDSVVQRVRAAIASTPEVDLGKVSAIKTAISNGSFKIDAKAVAKAYSAQEESSH